MYNLYYLKSTLDQRVYIGITKYPKERHRAHLKYSIQKSHYNGNWIRKTLEKGGEIQMNIVCSGLSPTIAMQLEIKMIAMFRKLKIEITNTADGGLGFNHKGIPHSEEHKAALEKAQPHKVRIPKDILYDLYVNQKLSKKKIGEIYECGATTIDRRLIEYNISPRTTPNYKVSYKLDRELVIKMFIEKNMTICDIAQKFGIGHSGIRLLLQREKLDTGLNNSRKKYDIVALKKRYLELVKIGSKKMKIWQTLSDEFRLSIGHISKLVT